MTSQRAAQRKNSPRQGGRPFGRATQEICPAISTHPHWGGDCTTTLRWQDVGADVVASLNKTLYDDYFWLWLRTSSKFSGQELEEIQGTLDH